MAAAERSRSGVESRLRTAIAIATTRCPWLAKRRISPHTLRHTTAMHLLQSGVDLSVIALWLGHESPDTTYLYLEADLAMMAIRREVRRDIAHSRIQELGKQRDVVTAKLSELNQVKLPKELGMRELQALLVWAPTIVLFGVTMKLGKTTASFLDVSSLDVN